MAKVISNKELEGAFFLLKVEFENDARPGQFFMLRAWDKYPLLSRPISVFDSDGATLAFLCRKVGVGTEILARLREGDELSLIGPLGSSFPDFEGKLALVGGGAGVAPMYFAAKHCKRSGKASVDIFLGFSEQAILEDSFVAVSDSLVVDVGGFITDKVDVSVYDRILACGPEIMMKTLYEKCLAADKSDALWVSMESRMACGIGACLVCSCPTAEGNKKICKDGPVLPGELVFSRRDMEANAFDARGC
ncbi:MAG: dihydroorotate dehydrogenase electron transfer subunit [Clostridiales Family XIII bacterium]|jgi:dihydroorotate dehydrogenase electron transfer subunit|nr:dihydroorotate dehydrogenase electron transfer subunit [Clostridiales Family XIII bacterium]